MKKTGFIILNKENNFGWDDNTEFYGNKKLAQNRVEELTEGVPLEEGEIKVVPATLTYEV